MTHRTWVEISGMALRQNLLALQNLLDTKTTFCAIVKGNAYGHGLEQISELLNQNNVHCLGVDSIDDALWIKQRYPDATVITLGYVVDDRLCDAVETGIHLTVYSKERVKQLQEIGARLGVQAHIHLKIETGTYRQGIMPEDVKTISDIISTSTYVHLAGVSTHFANIEDTTDQRYASGQYETFESVVHLLQEARHQPRWIHCACSAALILYPQTHGTLVRGGISLYGIWPSQDVHDTARRHGVRCDLTPVLTWKTRIVQIKSLPAGTTVGYGLSEVVKRQSRIAVLPVGYWDGFDRGLSSIGEILVCGHACKIIGRVCMNMCLVDVSFVPNVGVEQEVILLGRTGQHRIGAERIAGWLNTIPYEVVTRINPLLPRVIV